MFRIDRILLFLAPLLCFARPACETDIEEVYKMICELAVYERKDLATLPITKEKLQRFQHYYQLEVVEVDQKIAGYALYFYGFAASKGSPILIIEDLYIRPEYRGEGLGTDLLNTLIDYAKTKECSRLEWHCFDWNETALEFYKKIGGEVRKDLILIRLEINTFHLG